MTEQNRPDPMKATNTSLTPPEPSAAPAPGSDVANDLDEGANPAAGSAGSRGPSESVAPQQPPPVSEELQSPPGAGI